MTWNTALPLLIVLSSLLPGLVIFVLPERSHGLRTAFNLGGATVKLLLIGLLLVGVYEGGDFVFRLPLLPGGIDLVLHADALSMHFATLSALLWFITTIYAIGYLEGSPHRSRFFGWFSLCVSATVGIALAGNLFTFFLFYEILTLATWPLVVHRGTRPALDAGRVYLAWTLGGGALLLAAIVWLHTITGAQEFIAGGFLAPFDGDHRAALTVIFALLIAGFGVKAALVPLHTWLPRAMVAPAPVSALLHAVAVVKAGAFGIVRVVYEVFGAGYALALGVTDWLLAAAIVTILYGSIQALRQDELKRRLAYSTISQVSYIVLGTALAGPLGAVGGIAHLVHQGLLKITLFFCAGNIAETLNLHRVSEMNGVGRRMPWTMAAFTVGAFGMIGVPPLAGFITKWHLGLGALEVGRGWIIGVLALSSLLNAAYFLPVLYRAWFLPSKRKSWNDGRFADHRWETHWMLLLPTGVAAVAAIMAGLFAGTIFSPLGWSRLIALREFGP